MSAGSKSYSYEELKSKEKKFAAFNPKPKKKCICGKGLAYMQDKCNKCMKRECV